ncbi:MAG: TIGR03905 family TSCPD domain-containing protein [Oscillospiraceae bacterium]
MTYEYKTRGTCSRKITFDIENDILKNVIFEGGCNGNTKGVGILVEGKNAKDISKLLAGVNCGNKGTSCPDQLSKAIAEVYEQKNNI